ncbi:hypothetical protein Vadar_032711 [Vaccinium darrowii]|uniref:Uncharacterized protein n=1 Tax=Vaccinium darrowii TaxID=229202 RepID=A0ACB7Y3N3_9ERIC|nr:hypothetical protein Vadar_032711 [Vaccinium darrowii]
MPPYFHSNLHRISVLVLILVVIHLPSNVDAEIKYVKISSDSRPTIVFTEFCFRDNGRVSIAISNVSVTTTTSTNPTNNSRLSFLLIGKDDIPLFQDSKICIAEDRRIVPNASHTIVRFDELSHESSLKRTLPVPNSDRFGIYFSNCEPKSSVSMDLVIETYNLNNDTTKEYLGTGDADRPTLYFFFSLLYVPFIAIWFLTCYMNKAFVHKIHWVMAVLLLSKVLNLLCEAEDKYYIKITGTPHGWDVMFYTFYFIRALLFLTVIMLIGSGWSFLKPYLQREQKQVLAVGISLQIFATVSYIYINDNGPFKKNYTRWNVAFILLDLIGFAMVMAPTAMSIRSLRLSANADGNAARTLARMKLLRDFDSCAAMYWCAKMVIDERTLTDYFFDIDDCLSAVSMDACVEIFTIIFYIAMFYLFRPKDENEYVVVEDEEVSLATIETEFANFST